MLNDTGFDEVPKKYRKFYRRWEGEGDSLAPNEVLCPVCNVVVRSTRVGSGFTNRNAEVNDDELGFVASLDLSPQKARVLLMVAMTHATDVDSLRAYFGR